MLASTASAPQVKCCSLGLYWSRDLCSKHAGWLGDIILSRSDSERQRNLMMQDQCPLPVYYSQVTDNTSTSQYFKNIRNVYFIQKGITAFEFVSLLQLFLVITSTLPSA